MFEQIVEALKQRGFEVETAATKQEALELVMKEAESAESVGAGQVCALLGLTETSTGALLGDEPEQGLPAAITLVDRFLKAAKLNNLPPVEEPGEEAGTEPVEEPVEAPEAEANAGTGGLNAEYEEVTDETTSTVENADAAVESDAGMTVESESASVEVEGEGVTVESEGTSEAAIEPEPEAPSEVGSVFSGATTAAIVAIFALILAAGIAIAKKKKK